MKIRVLCILLVFILVLLQGVLPSSCLAGGGAPQVSMGTKMMNYVADHPEVGVYMMQAGGMLIGFGMGSIVQAGGKIAMTHLLGEVGINGIVSKGMSTAVGFGFSQDAKHAVKELTNMTIDVVDSTKKDGGKKK